MACRITVHYENFPRGTSLGISGIEAQIKNDEPFYLDNEAERRYELLQGQTLYDAYKGSDSVFVERVAEANIPDEFKTDNDS